MHKSLLFVSVSVLLLIAAVPAAADIERNPGSRSGAESDPSQVVTSRSAGNASPLAGPGSAADFDMSQMTEVLIRSIAKIAAFDFQRAADRVLDPGMSNENTNYPGGDPVTGTSPGIGIPADPAGDPDAGDAASGGIIETQTGTLYDKRFVPEYDTDDALEPMVSNEEISYPQRPPDSALERQLDRLSPGAGTWPKADGGTPAVRAGLLDGNTLEQAYVLAPTIASTSSVFVSILPAHAPVSLVLPGYPPRMPGTTISPVIRSVSRGNPGVKQVALTFDDGPHPEFTSQLLSVLEHYDVKATFFFVGVQSQKYPHWVKMTHQAGHEIASQTYDHFRLPRLPREEKEYQIDEFQHLVEGLVGATPRFLRPPGGQLDPETEQLVAQRNMVLGMWDVALNDTNEGRTAADMLVTARSETRPGSVILAHDGVAATVEMLPALIEYLQSKGYEFVTMTELSAGL